MFLLLSLTLSLSEQSTNERAEPVSLSTHWSNHNSTSTATDRHCMYIQTLCKINRTPRNLRTESQRIRRLPPRSWPNPAPIMEKKPKNEADQGLIITGPWRATRLWNDIVRSFYRGMPVKKHRKGPLKSSVVEDCFSGHEALEWMQKYLTQNPNFETEVTKEQTELLLQKILRAGLIEPVHMPLGFLAAATSQTALKAVELPSFSAGELYRFVPSATEQLRSPGKHTPLQGGTGTGHGPIKSVNSRKALATIDTNTPKRPSSALARCSTSLSLSSKVEEGEDRENDPKVDSGKSRSEKKDSETGTQELAPGAAKYTEQMKHEINRSYFQSLPPNSLIILDNDETWRQTWTHQLRRHLSAIHVDSLFINVSYIIYNMTKVSPKGVVKLQGHLSELDLPHWVLSAMKCLANWPKPLKMLNGQESSLPNYPGFVADVFVVVKDYFHGLGAPLISSDLFDMFISAFIKAEALGAKMRCVPQPSVSSLCSAPNRAAADSCGSDRRFYVMSHDQQDQFLPHHHERVATIRQTLEVLPPLASSRSCQSRASSSFSPQTDLSTFDSSSSMGSYMMNTPQSFINSTHGQNVYPPNSQFETMFLNEIPMTRVVANNGHHLHQQSQNHKQRYHNSHQPVHCRYQPNSQISQQRHHHHHLDHHPHHPSQNQPTTQGTSVKPLRRGSYRASIVASSNWDNRSVATQTSVEENLHQDLDSRVPRWRRSSRSRKSIAVMEPGQFTTNNSGIVNPAFQSSPSHLKGYSSSNKIRAPSVDDLLDLEGRSPDYIIPSKTVRKEKKKQRDRRGRSSSVDRCHRRSNSVSSDTWHLGSGLSMGTSTTDLPERNGRINHHANAQQFITSRFNHLTVKTPMNPIDFPPPDVHQVRAEPYHGSEETLSDDGIATAIETFKLLALLLTPANRRKLQLLLKFMKRVSTNKDLQLKSDRSNQELVVDTFFDAILRPATGSFNHDEELSRRIVLFFMDHYDQIWTPPESLRKEIEEKVSHTLSKKHEGNGSLIQLMDL